MYRRGKKKEGHSLIYVGKTHKYEDIVNVDAYSVLEDICQKAYDECGEVAYDWYPYSQSYDDLNELSEELTESVIAWLKKHDDMPNFYKITDIQEVRIQEE